MNVPVPTNRLVALTLTGALLTTVLAGALAFPGLWQNPGATGDTTLSANGQAADGAPTPNDQFTPAVETDSGYAEEEYEDEEKYEDEENEPADGEDEENEPADDEDEDEDEANEAADDEDEEE